VVPLPRTSAVPEDHIATSNNAGVRGILHQLRDLLLLPYALLVAVPRTMIPYETHQDSMLPTIRPGDRVMVLALEHLGAEPLRRGHLVVFESWHEGEAVALKRVIGAPGDEVEIRAHTVYVNGAPLDEPYAVPPTHGVVPPRRLGEGEYYVMGDNRGESCDSRTHGPLTLDRVIGRVILRNAPVTRMTYFD